MTSLGEQEWADVWHRIVAAQNDGKSMIILRKRGENFNAYVKQRIHRLLREEGYKVYYGSCKYPQTAHEEITYELMVSWPTPE